MMTSSTKVTVVVATLGRPEIVAATVTHLLTRQSRKPDRVIISCVSPADAGTLVDMPGVEVITGPKGLPRQRNAAIERLGEDTSVLVFFDDDFVAADGWLECAVKVFECELGIVGFTGHMLADDIKGPGLSFEAALTLVDNDAAPEEWLLKEPYSPYGCNMAFRYDAIGTHRFDERLVLYGWLEDRDFAAALRQKGGRFVKCSGARGVHMGTKRGRVPGEQLGYSQIVNPLYMLQKGTMTVGEVADHMFRNTMSNLVRSVYPETYVDRRGRLRGNLYGLRDAISGQLEPERAATLTR